MNRLLEGAPYVAMTDRINSLEELVAERLDDFRESAPGLTGNIEILCGMLRELAADRLSLGLHLMIDGVPAEEIPAMVALRN